MRYIYNFTIIPTTVDKEGVISNHLRHAHYPHSIDLDQDQIIAFNVPETEIKKMMALFEVEGWEYHDYEKSPTEYKLRFREVKRTIARNLENYWNFIRLRGQKKPDDEFFEEFVKKAFMGTDFNAWRHRFYLSLDIMGFDTVAGRLLKYDITEPIVKQLQKEIAQCANRLRVLEESSPSYSNPQIDYVVDILYEPDRLFCSCFCNQPKLIANSHFAHAIEKLRDANSEAFSGLASNRQILGTENIETYLQQMGIKRGSFFNLLPEWRWREYCYPIS